MRMASIPLFFFRSEKAAINYAGENAVLTHGDPRAADACRFYAALICGALQGLSKYELLDPKFYRAYHFAPPLHLDVIKIAEGSYKKKNGYKDGIRGKGYVLDALEAALWGVWNDQDSFERGVLSVVNLGDDTDTTAAIYGQLAGALYRIKQIPERWIQTLFQGDFIITMANWLYLGGELWWKENSPNALIALHPGYTSSESVH
ncbi:unnamed protein product [Didymodactylos carnosus]|uniref:ADP-ribosylhydrolase ARH3 n=1 Tax=Didymodactylos carnosus TaxID=1234261 RepID=A0A8S2X8P5_9BILA|nr:unnamed protein product [Didymodactylos carnosus]